MPIDKRSLYSGVDKQIAGTRLAYHLRQIEQMKDKHPDLAGLAKQALSGRIGAGVVYKHIGDGLKKAGHELGTAYNWGRLADSLSVDMAVREYVDKRLKGYDEGKRGRLAATHFATGIGRKQKAGNHDDFWDGLRNHVKGRLGGVVNAKHLTDDMLNRSLVRHAAREDDREQVDTTKIRKDKPVKGGGTDHPWQSYLGMLPGRGSAEQYRRKRYAATAEGFELYTPKKKGIFGTIRDAATKAAGELYEGHIRPGLDKAGLLPPNPEIGKAGRLKGVHVDDLPRQPPPPKLGILHKGETAARERVAARHALRSIGHEPVGGPVGEELVNQAMMAARHHIMGNLQSPHSIAYGDATLPFHEAYVSLEQFGKAASALAPILKEQGNVHSGLKAMLKANMEAKSDREHQKVVEEQNRLNQIEDARAKQVTEEGYFPLEVPKAKPGKKLKVRDAMQPKQSGGRRGVKGDVPLARTSPNAELDRMVMDLRRQGKSGKEIKEELAKKVAASKLKKAIGRYRLSRRTAQQVMASVYAS